MKQFFQKHFLPPEDARDRERWSPAQRAYLERELLHRRQVTILRAMIFILFLALWELGAATGAVDDFIFSSPSRIVLCFLSMMESGAIFFHTGVTLYETLLSFFLTIFFSLLLSILLWSSPMVSRILEPYLVMLNSLPKSAMAPLLIVWLGANLKTIVVAAVSVAVFGSVMTLYTSFSQTDQELIKLIRSFGGGKREILLKILLPASVPVIISSMIMGFMPFMI